MDRRSLERLGHYIVSRRVALGFRNRTDLANSLQFTVRTLADIEHGVRKASPGTYAMLENKLAWAPGSIDTILAGGEPNETVTELRRPAHNPLAHTSTTDALSRLHRRVTAGAATAHRRPPPPTPPKPGMTGTTALTRKATGPNRASGRTFFKPPALRAYRRRARY